MSSVFEELASKWNEQMEKMAALFALTTGPMKENKLLEKVKERIKGATESSVKELENLGLTKAMLEGGEKIYELTDRGKSLFKTAAESHFRRVETVRSWFIRTLIDLDVIEESNIDEEISSAREQLKEAANMLFEKPASDERKLEVLEKLKEGLDGLEDTIKKMMEQINGKIAELKSD
jgi:hypothetical protein